MKGVKLSIMKKLLRGLAALCLLSIAAGILAFVMSSGEAANRDLVSYWAAGKQLVNHANPYDEAAVLALEKQAGLLGDRPYMMRNTPSAFFLVAPLGWLTAKGAAVAWSLILIVMLIASVHMIRVMAGGSTDRLHLLGYLFPPVLACLLAGQMGIVLLFSVSLMLYLIDSQPYFAGLALVFCTVKPQLFFAFAVVLGLWALRRRRFLLGLLSAVAFSLVTGALLDSSGWSQYARMMQGTGIADEFIPTLSLGFRLLIHRNAVWLQFVPCLLASVWAGWWHFRRQSWDWRTDGMLVLCVSVAVAPYEWVTDEAVLLPAILFGLYRATGRALTIYAAIAGLALLLVLFGAPMTAGSYMWTCPAWLGWYLYVRSSSRSA
jgi:hypothetical protein